MQTLRIPAFLLLCGCVLAMTGCVSEQEYKDLQLKNAAQARRITDLSSELEAKKIELDQLKRQLRDASSISGVEQQSLQQKIAALEKVLQEKQALIERLKGQLMGGVQLPVELSTMLEDFARQHEMVTYDAERGIVKFKSDLLFEKGSDEVKADAAEAVKTLCKILNGTEGQEFDVIIAGHTDDIPIGRPETLAKHPTNWHLSAHRAISVLKIMTANQIDPTRVSARGFGEYRPVAANKPNKGGNPQNRRVEIYIVPKGM